MVNYWLIPMDYRTCNYKELKQEWDMNKKIMWQAPGNTKLKDGKWVITGNMANNIKSGDIIYFYITNLPSESKNNLSRIMLRGVVDDPPYPMELNKVYSKSEDSTMVVGFSIKSLTTLYKAHLEDNNFLNYHYLLSRYKGFIYPQGRRWPNKEINNNLSDELIDSLEQCFKTNLMNNDFNELINHFNKKCFFCNKYGCRSDHKTFVGRNGLDYFEEHHFIPQFTVKKHPELECIVYDSTNTLSLCSNCHNKFHYGSVDEVSNMLEIVLADEGIQSMLEKYNFHEIIGPDVDINDWFKEIYNVKVNKRF